MATKNSKVVPSPDGVKAYLPHVIAQGIPFFISRLPRGQHAQFKEGPSSRKIVIRENYWGDRMKIESRRPLLVVPDMGVFLGTIALIQANKPERLIKEKSGEPSNRLFSEFPLRDLYNLLRASKGRERLKVIESLEVLGGTTLSISIKNPQSTQEHQRMRGRHLFESFWDFEITPRRGRGGSIITFYPLSALIPRDEYLWVDAATCNALRQDMARAIFWALLCRQHFAGTIAEWQQLLGTKDRNIWRWRDQRFLPALEELSMYGFKVREEEDKYVVSRPRKKIAKGS